MTPETPFCTSCESHTPPLDGIFIRLEKEERAMIAAICTYCGNVMSRLIASSIDQGLLRFGYKIDYLNQTLKEYENNHLEHKQEHDRDFFQSL